MNKPLIPPPLKKGDCIGIFAPAGFLEEKGPYNEGIRILRELGFRVKSPSHFWPTDDYLADNDKNRSEEFNRLWNDPDVNALLALRGGYGCLRILDRIELPLIAKKPKLLIGFSDITILNNYLTDKTGLVTMHGPVLTTLHQLNKESMARFYYSLLGKWNNEIRCRHLEILQGGDEAQGELAGGNLSSLVSLLGTPYEPDWRNKIVFLEDIHEPMYRLDRLFTQLMLAGKFEGASGIILGDFSISGHQDTIETIRHHEKIWSRVLELTGRLQIPLWGGFDVGHTPHNLTLPLGAKAIMNSRRGVLEFVL